MKTAIVSNRVIRAPGVFERGLSSQLEKLQNGVLRIRSSGEVRCYGQPSADGLTAQIDVHRSRFFRRAALGGSLGAAESYMDGDWSSADLSALARLLARNAAVLDGLEGGIARLGLIGARALYSVRRNTRKGSRRNIADHYDLGNDFFERMLDPTMTYSSAVFDGPEMTLEQASTRKLDLLCKKLDLKESDHLLEIGTGWGSMAIHAAANYGCRVTTTTISAEQHRLASRRVRSLGLAGRVEVLQRDYRDLEGRYDKIVSVEMIEAVGWRYYDAFFAKCASLLVPGGRLAMQAITIGDNRFESSKNEADFIKRYIFPGSCIPSVSALVSATARTSDLRLRMLEDYTPNYARTLQAWAEQLAPHRPWVVARYGERFWRMWSFYLAYCEGAFAEGYIGLVQMGFERDRWAQQ